MHTGYKNGMSILKIASFDLIGWLYCKMLQGLLIIACKELF